ncbi:peptidylprolyl isomerase [Candidatus Pacearchaeota archaeon]|nr:peptidylprolyl isomerase [Candidatus Pacearchaeota archaeon]
MEERTQNNDFIELDFTGYLQDGSIFDTNNEQIAQKNKLDIKNPERTMCIGQRFLVKGFDNALIGKEIGKEYVIELSPKDAFGDRMPELVKTMPIAVFHKQNINPAPGMSFFLDNYFVRISAVSGGRVIADFNNPLAGKKIKYKFTVIRKITDMDEKIKALMRFFYRQEFEFSIEDKKIIVKLSKNLAPLIEIAKPQWREILGFEIVSEEKDENSKKIKEAETKPQT